MSDVVETDLPGIGKRYDVAGMEGTRAVVVLHHSGRREVYLVPNTGTITLTDRQARTLGAILAGAYFTPAVVEEMDAVIDDLLVDWVTLPDSSPAVGRTIADLEIRRRTRMTVAAIAGGGRTVIAPEPHERLAAGDRLVVVGRTEDLAGFTALVVGVPGG